jgi:hypothetical protein
VKFVAVLYVFFFGLAVNGLISWGRELRTEDGRQMTEVIPDFLLLLQARC